MYNTNIKLDGEI